VGNVYDEGKKESKSEHASAEKGTNHAVPTIKGQALGVASDDNNGTGRETLMWENKYRCWPKRKSRKKKK